MISSWVILAAIAGLASNASNFLSRIILKDGDDGTAFAWYSDLLRCLGFAVIAIFDWHIVVTAKSIILLITIGLVECIGIYYWMQMHSLSHLSLSSLLTRTRLIWIPIIAFILIGERLRIIDYAGIIILFFGISIAVSPHKLIKDAGIKAATLSAFFVSIEIVLTKMLLPYASIGIIQAVSFFPAIFVIPFFMNNPKARIKALAHNNMWLKTATVGVFLISNYVYTVALKVGDASRVTAIYQGMMIFAVLAGIIILHERQDVWKKIAGSVIIVLGAILLS